MTSELDDPYPPRRSRRWLTVLILMGIAFVGGIAATISLFKRSDRIAAWVRPLPAPVIVTRAAPARFVAQPRATTDPLIAQQARALDQRLRTIELRMGQIDTRARAAVGNADRAEGLLVAFAARRALDRGIPLGYIEALLRDRFGGTQPQAVAAVIGASQRPATLDEIRSEFETAAPQLVAGENGGDWWAAFKREVSGLVVVRRSGTPSTAAVDRIARARSALEAGQVDVALAEVARMPARDKAASWIAVARRYVAARNALDAIETAALLTPDTKPAPAMDATVDNTQAVTL